MSLKQQEHARNYRDQNDVSAAISRRMQYNNRLSLANVGPEIVYLSRGPGDVYTLSTHETQLWQGYFDELCALLDTDTSWHGVKARDVQAELLRIY